MATTDTTSALPGENSLYAVSVETDIACAGTMETALLLLHIDATCWRDEERGACRFEWFFSSGEEAEAELAGLHARLACLDRDCSWEGAVRRLRNTDWREGWKRFFRAARVSERIVVRPPWESVSPQPGEVVVEIDPGMSFGTGQHFTTRSCLQLIDLYGRGCRGLSFLDVGCGSGILAIAAAKLGFSNVTAVDNDPEAVCSAEENVARNGVATRVTCITAGLDGLSLAGRFDIVAANLQADILVPHAAVLTGLLAGTRGARLIVSGVLREQYPGVRRAFEQIGFAEKDLLSDSEWIAAGLGRR